MKRLNCKNLNLLTIFLTANPKTKELIIQKTNNEFIYLLLEIILNTLNGNIPIEKTIIKKLNSFKFILRTLCYNQQKSLNYIKKELIKIIKVVEIICANFISSKIYKSVQQKCLVNVKKS